MSAEMAQKLVQGGIKAVRNGDHELARKAFTQALKLDPNNEAAWLGMATITEGTTDKLRILNRILEINPDNERAKEAIRRLDGETETASEPEEAVDDTQVDEDAVFTTGEIEPLSNMPRGDTGELSSFPKPDWALDEDVPGVDDVLEESDIFSEPEKPKTEETIPPLVIRNSSEVFASLPPAPTIGQGGIPVPRREVVETVSEETAADIQAYLEDALADYLTPQTRWTRKTRGRAGSGEYRNFMLQASAASFVSLLVVLVALTAFLLTNATTRRILLAPTTIPSATPTNTPTATPGVTNTPSPTPMTPATETPELPLQATRGFADPNFPPQPTRAYYLRPVDAASVPDEILSFMDAGEMDEALELLEEAVQIEQDTGAFPPIYRLSQWHLLNDDPEQARQVVTDWQDRSENFDSNTISNSEPLVLIALARVDLYEIRNGLGDRATLLDSAQDKLEAAVGLAVGDNQIDVVDRLNAEAYLLLAEVFILRNNVDGALEVLDEALQIRIDNRGLVGDTTLRMAKVRILADAGRYPEAFQELYFILEFNPFHEEALIFQTELALETDQPGLAVLYAEQYLLYYPGSLRGLYLIGQAREAESKFDLALNAYSRAVAGDRENEVYISDPYFLENLLARADLLVQQGREDEAAEDLNFALELAGDDPALQARSIAASFSAANYEVVIEQAEALLDESTAPNSDVLYYQGLSLIALADAGEADGDYGQAIEALEDALNANLASEFLATAYENLAKANLEVNNLSNALEAINSAIELETTGYRVYLRGLILEAQRSTAEAFLDYEFVVTWGQYFSFPFYEDAFARYESLLSSQR